MPYIRYNTETQKRDPTTYRERYTVDGQPAELAAPWVELELIQQPQPYVPDGKMVQRAIEINYVDKTYVEGWALVDLPPEVIAQQKREALRNALRTRFAMITDENLRASLNTQYAAIEAAFERGETLGVIRAMLSQVDVSDVEYLENLQTEMLALPEWAAAGYNPSA